MLQFRLARTKSLNYYFSGAAAPVDADDDLIPADRAVAEATDDDLIPIDRMHISSVALLEKKTIVLDNVYDHKDHPLFQGILAYDQANSYRTESMLVIPMCERNGNPIGVLQLINAKDEAGNTIAFDHSLVDLVESFASLAAVAILNARYLDEVENLLLSFVEVIAQSIGKLTPYNENHTRNIVNYADRFIDYLKTQGYDFDENHKKEFLLSCWLHDIGKLVTPVWVMNKNTRLKPEQTEALMHRLEKFSLINRIKALEKQISSEEEKATEEYIKGLKDFVLQINEKGYLPDDQYDRLQDYAKASFLCEDGSCMAYLTGEELDQLSIRKTTLTAEEWEIMRNHAALTDELLASVSFPQELPHVREWAAAHHEKLDGSGYPKGLQGDQIPTEVRILTILDIFEALTAKDRDYKTSKTPEQALAILKEDANSGKLDRRLLELFEQSHCWDMGT